MKKCRKHPHYIGNKIPEYECSECLELYFLLKHPRAPHKPTRLHKDKSKYSRKTKHKNLTNK
jgi:hypothetical protein